MSRGIGITEIVVVAPSADTGARGIGITEIVVVAPGEDTGARGIGITEIVVVAPEGSAPGEITDLDLNPVYAPVLTWTPSAGASTQRVQRRLITPA